MKTCIKYGPVDASHYFDVVNIDRYDVILGTVFMRKHGIVLDFGKDQVRMGDKMLPALHEGEDKYLQVRRQVMRFHEEASTEARPPDKGEGTSKGGQ
jgi:hypothetical protein